MENEQEIFLIDSFFLEGPATKANAHNQDDIGSQTGMTAWMHAFGDLEISTQADGKISAVIKLKNPN